MKLQILILWKKGSSRDLKFIAAAGYFVEDVFLDGKSIGSVNFYQLKNIQENHKISVLFSSLNLKSIDESSKQIPDESILNKIEQISNQPAVSQPHEIKQTIQDIQLISQYKLNENEKQSLLNGVFQVIQNTDQINNQEEKEKIISALKNVSLGDDLDSESANKILDISDALVSQIISESEMLGQMIQIMNKIGHSLADSVPVGQEPEILDSVRLIIQKEALNLNKGQISGPEFLSDNLKVIIKKFEGSSGGEQQLDSKDLNVSINFNMNELQKHAKSDNQSLTLSLVKINPEFYSNEKIANLKGDIISIDVFNENNERVKVSNIQEELLIKLDLSDVGLDDSKILTPKYFNISTGQWDHSGITHVSYDQETKILSFEVNHLTGFAVFEESITDSLIVKNETNPSLVEEKANTFNTESSSSGGGCNYQKDSREYGFLYFLICLCFLMINYRRRKVNSKYFLL